MRKVFLTGASAGIGRATAELLVHSGYQVWGTSRHKAKLPQLPNFQPIELDLASSDSIRSAYQEAVREAGHFEILINNAGEGLLGPLEAFDSDAFRRQLEILVVGPHELIRQVLPSMRQQNQGTILNVSSLAARFPVPFLGPYSAAKAALSNYAETLRLELTGTGVRVIDLQPGDLATSFAPATQRIDASTVPFYEPNLKAAWEVMEANMRQGPAATLAANKILRLLESPGTSSPRTVGTFSQAILSPLLARVLPKWLMEKGLKDYYKLR